MYFFFEPAALSSLSWIRYLSQMSHFGPDDKSVFFDLFQAWGPKASQRASKGIPKGVQRHPKGSPKEAKELQDVPKGGQGAPKDTPRRFKGTQRRPKADPSVAKWPKGCQSRPKEIHGGQKGYPRQGTPKKFQKGSTLTTKSIKLQMCRSNNYLPESNYGG